MATDPRRLALEVTLEVDEGARSDEALSRALDASSLEGADRGLATRLVYGVLARRRTLDHTIAARAGRTLAKIDPYVLAVLRLGLFQLAYLDRVPAYAAISTSVDLVRRRARSASGFVNAVLRGVQREGMAIAPRHPPATHIAIEHSCENWLAQMWIDELGRDEAEAMLAASLEVAPTSYRALCDRDEALARLAEAGITAEPGRFGARSLIASGETRAVPGLVIPQGEASQLVVEMLDPQPGERVLDACAAPGGKTAYIAALVGAGGSVAAVDESPTMRARIEATLANARPAARVSLHEGGIERFARDHDGDLFDAVLVDAPCSGLGTLRQHPEIRWRRTSADIEDLAARQARILAAAAPLVRPGGRLVYSTCTVSVRENDALIDALLGARRDFARRPLHALPAHVAELCDADGTLRTFPHRHALDGFFAVAMERMG